MTDTEGTLDTAKDLSGEIGIILPSIDPSKAKATAAILKARAGVGCVVIICHDVDKRGFIYVANSIFERSRFKYVVYLAEDAFPGINWLRLAYDELEKSGKSLFAFNDGKWFGKVASFGMVRAEWARKNYPSGCLFYEGYKRHYADIELTNLARHANLLCFSPYSVLIEVDPSKGTRWTSDESDAALFKQRKTELDATLQQQEAIQGIFDKHEVLQELHEAVKPKFYFEIGVQHGKSLMLSLLGTKALGVDPNPLVDLADDPNRKVLRMTSDDFFVSEHFRVLQSTGESPDLVFIDGMHKFDFLVRDLLNVLRWVKEGAVIVIDDIFPNHPRQALPVRVTRNWPGDVFKVISFLDHFFPSLPRIFLDVRPTGLLVLRKNDGYDEIALDGISEQVRGGQENETPSREILERDFTDINHQRSDKFPGLKEFLKRFL